MKIEHEFYGEEFLARFNRAAGRAIVAIGVNAAIETKRITHVKFGTLSRSVHAAPPNEIHEDDENEAAERDMLRLDVEPAEGEFGPCIEVGSWLPYACVEWVGRGHPGITQGVEMVRGAKATAIVHQAFAEEGLSGGLGTGL